MLEIDLEDDRRRLRGRCSPPAARLSAMPAGPKFHELLSSLVPTADVADLLAFHLLEGVAAKQSLLAEADPRRRVHRLLAMLAAAVVPPRADGQRRPRGRQPELTRASRVNASPRRSKLTNWS